MKKTTIILLSGIISACSPKLSNPTNDDLTIAKSKFGDVTLQELQEGKKLYQENCNLCHKLYKPQMFSEEKWRNIIPPMVRKVNKKVGQEVLKTQDENKILKYVLTMQSKK